MSKTRIVIHREWIAAGISGSLVVFTLIAVILLVCRRHARQVFQQTDSSNPEDRGHQALVPSNNGLGAVSFNVTLPLPPPEDGSDSDEEDDADQHWSNGVVLEPESHPI